MRTKYVESSSIRKDSIMEIGKSICRELKKVRMKIAVANDIEYTPSECHHKGDCLGTCPRCEYEVKYIEEQLRLRRAMGKAVSLAGLCVGISAITSSCVRIPQQLAGIPMMPPEHLTQTDTLQQSSQSEPHSMAVHNDTIGEDILLGDVVEITPSFPGGQSALMTYLSENFKYPSDCSDVSGRVVVTFMVETDGSLSDIKVVRSVSKEIDDEFVRVVKAMPKWSPGSFNGKKRRVKYNLPFTVRSQQ